MREFGDSGQSNSFGGEIVQNEALSDEQMGNLISAVGNSEAKAVTLLVMEPGIIYSESDLFRAVRDSQGQFPGWNMGVRLPYNYCKKSFSEIGLVAAEVIDEHNNEFGYVKTEYGEGIGTRFAATMLDFSRSHPDISLSQIFSSTSSPSKAEEKGGVDFKKRAPITRLNLFRELSVSPLTSVHVNELAQRIDEKEVSLVSRHIEVLRRAGLVTVEDGFVNMPDSSRQLFSDLILSLHDFQQMSQSSQINADIVASYSQSHPEEIAALLRKAKESSSNAEQSPVEATSSLIISILRNNPNISADSVREALKEHHGKSLSTHRTRRIIRMLEQQGKVSPGGPKNGVLWSLSDDVAAG